MLNDITSDLRHAVRARRRSPGFTCTVVVTLTLAIGANLTVFTLANALILANLPVPRPERLLEMNGALFPGSVDEVAGDYYSTLGIRPALGRFISPRDIGLDHCARQDHPH
jgi:hypothetical protein